MSWLVIWLNDLYIVNTCTSFDTGSNTCIENYIVYSSWVVQLPEIIASWVFNWWVMITWIVMLLYLLKWLFFKFFK